MNLEFNFTALFVCLLLIINSSCSNTIDYIEISGAPCTIDYHTWNDSETIRRLRTEHWILKKKLDLTLNTNFLEERLKVNTAYKRIQPIYLIEIFFKKDMRKTLVLVDRKGNIQYENVVYFPIEEVSDFLRSRSKCFLVE